MKTYEEKINFIKSLDFDELIKCDAHDLIMQYVRVCKCLSVEDECALIKRGITAEIIAYISGHYLEPESFDELLARGNATELKFYISRYGLYAGTEQEFSSLMNIPGALPYIITEKLNEIDKSESQKLRSEDPFHLSKDEQNRIRECNDAFASALIKTCNHEMIRLYISKQQLSPKVRQLLGRVGDAIDNLIYYERWEADSSYN